jgi:periplasmic divalent cation tolerance protein
VASAGSAAGAGSSCAAGQGDGLELILTSCHADDAPTLAAALIEQRVAACVSTIPGAQSTYRWQGQVCHEAEALLLIKTTRERRPACVAALERVHPYDVPEVVVLDATHTSPAYLRWAIASVRGPDGED